MLTHILSPDTQAILLLCANFGQNRQTEVRPLSLSEYNTLTNWLIENQLTPANLLELSIKKLLLQNTIGRIDSHRLCALLERGVMLSLAVEKWTSQGLWILGRSDSEYPKCLKQKLRHSAPAILYGVGNTKLLSQGGLAIVGSRDVDEEGLDYTQKVVQICAEQEIQVISGGARGVDRASMLGTLAAGGTAIGVLADSLASSAVAGKYRTSIQEGRLTLISACDPGDRFNVGNAMARNKYIYALANYALVVSSSVEKGGTWAGAIEALEKIKDVPVLVRMQGNIPEGNCQLAKKGAIPFPEAPWNRQLKNLIVTTISDLKPEKNQNQPVLEQLSILSQLATQSSSGNSKEEFSARAINTLVKKELKDCITDESKVISYPKTVYEAVLPLIIQHLDLPKNDKYLARYLDVQLGQMQVWLKRAVQEGKLQKNRKPVTYQIKQENNLETLN
jgi:predicted Rossmann fold nucleotide-binding protein DprA/Smf involved in DNA uptake